MRLHRRLPVLIALAAACAALRTGGAAPSAASVAPRQKEVFLAIRKDGQNGTGTRNDPHDASTREKFDALMHGFEPYTTIHIGPGLYLTNGRGHDGLGTNGFIVKEGQRIIGSGPGVTTVRLAAYLPNIYERTTVFFTPLFGRSNNCLLSDLTIDCNSQNLTFPANEVIDGANLGGSNIVMRNLEVINPYAGSLGQISEGFCLVVGATNGDFSATTNAMIENCYVHQVRGYYVSAICIFNSSGVIRNCVVEGNPWLAYSFQGDGIVIENNKAVNCGNAIRFDTPPGSNVLITGNDFRVTGSNIWLTPQSAHVSNFIIKNNYFENSGTLANDPNNPKAAIRLTGLNSFTISNVLITGNIYNGSSGTVFVSITDAHAKNVLIDKNRTNQPSLIVNQDATVRVGANGPCDCFLTRPRFRRGTRSKGFRPHHAIAIRRGKHVIRCRP